MCDDSLLMVKYAPNDFGEYWELVKEENVMRYITGHNLTKREAKIKFEEILAINQEEQHFGYFKILKKEQVIVGDCKLERYRQDRSKLEIGYILHESFWGMGYGTLICIKLLAIAEKIAPSTDIIGIIDPENVASKRILEKFGFRSFFIGTEDNLPTEKLLLSAKK